MGPIQAIWVNKKEKVLIYQIPRNGSSMIRTVCDNALGYNYSDNSMREGEKIDYNKLSEDHSLKLINNKDYTKIAILRNPLKRYISTAFHQLEFKVREDKRRNDPKKREVDSPERIEIIKKMTSDEIIKYFINITNEVEGVGVEDFGFRDVHFLSQNYYLSKAYRQDNIVNVDRYFILDDIEDEYDEFKKLTKAKIGPFGVNRLQLPEEEKMINEYMSSNKELVNKINKIYEKDWKLYNDNVK